MLLAFSSLDVAVLVLYVVAMLAIGIYFAGTQKSTEEFFLASRSLGWFPLGLSLMATLISALSFTGVPAKSYEFGLRTLWMPLAVWMCVPILFYVAIPIFRGLKMTSIYEYLELRFDSRTRMAATILFAAWRLLWLGGVLYAPCMAFSAAVGWQGSTPMLVIILGVVTTAYTFLGGYKAVVWTDVVQGLVMIVGAFVVIFGIWSGLSGGPTRVWEVAQELHRTEVFNTQFDWTKQWTPWGFIPHFALAMLSFYLADQITAQRFLTAKSVTAAQQSLLLNCGAISILFPCLTYIGICLLAYYHDHPEDLRAAWVTNVDPIEPHDYYREPNADRPLLDPRQKADALTVENIPQLVRERRILQPNRLEPFENVEDFTDSETGKPLPKKLLMRTSRGEVLLHRNATDELLPCFVSDHLPAGIAGLVFAALLAASMSSMDSGLNSICTLLIKDVHERGGVGQKSLARIVKKPVDQLDDHDRLKLAQPLTAVIGVAATIMGLFIGRIGNIFEIMVGVVNTFGAPLLGVFLLGMFTRRTTSMGAFVSLIGGSLFTVGFMCLYKFSAFAALRPGGVRVDEVWTVVFGTAFTLLLGWLISFVFGRPKSPTELRGLVFGCGEPGVLAKQEETPKLIKPPAEEKRWKK